MKQHEQSGAVPYKKTQASGTVGFKAESYGHGVESCSVVTGRVERKMMPTPWPPNWRTAWLSKCTGAVNRRGPTVDHLCGPIPHHTTTPTPAVLESYRICAVDHTTTHALVAQIWRNPIIPVLDKCIVVWKEGCHRLLLFPPLPPPLQTYAVPRSRLRHHLSSA